MGRGLIALLLAGCVAEAAPPVRHPAGQGGIAVVNDIAGTDWVALDLTSAATSNDPNSELHAATTYDGTWNVISYTMSGVRNGYDEGPNWRFVIADTLGDTWTNDDRLLVRITLKSGTTDPVATGIVVGIDGTTSGRAVGLYKASGFGYQFYNADHINHGASGVIDTTRVLATGDYVCSSVVSWSTWGTGWSAFVHFDGNGQEYYGGGQNSTTGTSPEIVVAVISTTTSAALTLTAKIEIAKITMPAS